MKRFSSRLPWIPLGASAVILLCQCGFVDTAGALFVSEQDEMQLGAEFDRQLRDSAQAEYPLYRAVTPQQQAFQAYVTDLAQSVLAAVPANGKPGYGFKFTLIDKDVVNAFAVPGGYVYIYTGIIKDMRDESELAGVLGHEIAHVTRHHYRDAMVKQTGLSLLIQALVGDDAGLIAQLVGEAFFTLAALKVSRENESEADEYGTRYTAAVGRNPMGIAKFFSRVKGGGLEWFSTHPEPDDRVKSVEDEVRADPALSAVAADSAVTNYKSRFDSLTAVVRQP